MIKSKYFLLLVSVPFLLFIFLYYLEFFNYLNFVYSHFHIDIYRYKYIPGVLIGAWLTFYLLLKKQKINAVLVFVFCLVIIPGITEAFGLTLARTHQMFLGKSYITQKVFRTNYGDDYKFIGFIRSYILDNGLDKNLVLPPNKLPWRHTGNNEIMDGFLYPISTQTFEFVKSKNYLISSESDGANYHLWPDFKIPANQIIIYDWEKDKAVIYDNKDWDPSEWQDKNPWGLIITK